MFSHLLINRRFRQIIVAILSVALICSSIPLQGWGPISGLSIAHAASLTTDAVPVRVDAVGPSAMQKLQDSWQSSSDLIKVRNLGLDAQSNGLMINANAMQSIADSKQHKPDSLINPLSISRAQSAYRAADSTSGTLIITFTVTNNQPPSVTLPQLPVTATITNTIAAFSSFDLSRDPNVIHNVLVADSLADQAAFISSYPEPDCNGIQCAWNLGSILPLSSVTATLMVRIPMTLTGFVELDTGAMAWGTLQNRMIGAQARPASLAPDTLSGEPIGDWLAWTVDADKYDEYMLVKAAELGQDPVRMFEYVRSLGYESYKGSLRGTRGTLWSKAGNSLDQASLLIAMLRASGIPSRYRHGALSKELAQELIRSMFPQPTETIGQIPSGTNTRYPEDDQKLLAETQDHWWVEAYLPGQGWINLDPSFRHAAIGQNFVLNRHCSTTTGSQMLTGAVWGRLGRYEKDHCPFNRQTGAG